VIASKSRRCSNCRKKVPIDSIYVTGIRAFCCIECLMLWGKSESAKKAVKESERRAQREKNSKDKEMIKSRSEWLSEAQAAFNKYVRERDKKEPCISCSTWEDDNYRGGKWDCGHYRSRGSAPHLRFHLWNAHKQCVKCNRFLSGNIVEFRKGLEYRIGAKKLEYVETYETITPLNINRLKRIKKIFTRKHKHLLKYRLNNNNYK
tara:strand:+ start:36 stop:650 length:615 start_codon:yes stop_codon:yes gene_type:complete